MTNRIVTARRALIAALLIAGCDGGGAGDGVTRTDSAGVEIVQNTAPDSAGVTWWSLVPAPRIDIGTAEGAESEVLFGVNDAVRLSDGRLVVVNGGTSQVRYYSGNTLEATVGRNGAGPGEFQRIAGLFLMPGDSVGVIDPQAQRVTVLDEHGAVVRMVQNEPGQRATVLGRRDDGMWVGQTNITSANPMALQGHVRPNIVFVTVAAIGGGVIDTIGQFAGAERFVRVQQQGGAISSINIMGVPFGKTTAGLIAGNDLVVSTQDAAEVRVYDVAGKLHRIVRTGAALERVTPELVEKFVTRQLERVPEDQRVQIRQSMMELPTPEFVPPYGSMLLDRSGNLWLQDYPDLSDDRRWTVFDSTGARVARIVLPLRFTPYDIGADWILGRELDELDVEHVRVYTVQRSR